MSESLIEQVKQHDVLFNLNNPDYRNQARRQVSWEDIGRELNIDPEAAKTRWDKLRRCYINALHRRRNNLNGPPSIKKTKWKYEKQMSFLLPFIEHYRKTPIPAVEEPKTVQSFEVLAPIIKPDKLKNEITIPPNIKIEETVSDKEEPSVPTTSRNTPDERSCAVSDETDMFFMSLSKMTKALPPLDQAKIKLAVSHSVLRSQMKFYERSANGYSPQMDLNMECDVDFENN